MVDEKHPPISSNKAPGPATPSPTGSGFDVASTSTQPTTQPPVDAIDSSKPTEKPVGMENKINEAKMFNSKLKGVTDKELAEEMHNRHVLQNAIGSPDALEKEAAIGFPTKPDRNARILEVLRNKGMDSQQAQQALTTINEILYEDTVVVEDKKDGKEKK